MLRHFAQHNGGVKNYTQRLLENLFNLDSGHEFVLMYNSREHLGTYEGIPGVIEVAVPCPSAFLWDQLVVPYLERRFKLDLIFNPKYSAPLAARCPIVWVSHGLDWYVMPWGSTRLDRLSHRHLIPRYARKAARIITVSENTLRDAVRFLNVPESRMQVVYHGIGEQFRAPVPEQLAADVKAKYKLPDKFLLYAGGVYPAKNFRRLVEAYSRVGPELGIHLVIAGEHTYMCEEDFTLPEKIGISDWVHYAGWIEHDELPAFYRLTTALVLPSLYEACPSPILEAMAVGCPVVTGDRAGMSEIAGGSALLVNPESVTDIAEGFRRITIDPELRRSLIEKGRRRAAAFTWQKCAEETLALLEETLGLRRTTALA